MRRHVLALLLLAASCACAETIVLHTGARVQGTIVFQNEEVVIIRDAAGARFQYPQTDVKEILTDDQEVVAAEEQTVAPDEPTKKVSILLELAGGAGIEPKDTIGGAFSVNFLVGSHHIGQRHVFAGAGLGYHGFFLGAEKYNFLPIQVAVRMPFTEQKHAPMFGVAVGYGVALSKNYLGGLYAGLDFGYRCQLNPSSAIALTVYGQFQQARVTTTEYITAKSGETVPFANTTGRSLIASGLKLSLYF